MNSHSIRVWTVRALLLISVVYAFTQIVSVAGGAKQHDFRTYYYAAKAYQQGLNPYVLDSMRHVSGVDDLKLPFVYPPHGLELFLPFTLLDYYPAYYLFFAMKLAALLALVTIWIKIIPVSRNDWWALCVTVLIGYRYAVLRDMRSGNISTFEQLMIWSGILLAIRHHSVLSGISIALSSVFKLITASLIPLVIIINRTWRSLWSSILVICMTISAYLVLFISQPDLWKEFILSAGAMDERGNRNPSSLALIQDLAEVAEIEPSFIYVSYTALCIVILSILIWAFVTTRSSRDVYPMLYLTLLAYVLLAPRLKDYSLIILLLPTLHILSSMVHCRWQAVVGCVLLWIPIINYQSLLLAFFAFVLNLKWIWDHRMIPNARVELTLNPLSIFAKTQSLQ